MVTDQGLFQSGDVYWDPSYFTGTEITREQYEKCVRITWDIEVGSANGDWTRCKPVGDGHGISYGPYQFTEKSGLLTKVIQEYFKMKGTNNLNEHDEIIKKSKFYTDSDYAGVNYSNDYSLRNALSAIGSDQFMKNAQGKIFLENRAKKAVGIM